ncbi:MAG: 3'-5' exonuclease [Gemmataceae bacterium]
MAFLHRYHSVRRPKTVDLGMGRFAAIDFETADNGQDSACSLAIIVGQGTEIVETRHILIRPPRSNIRFTHIHGITWDDVKGQPTFGDLWPTVEGLFTGCQFIAAHFAAFDRGVLKACCDASGFTPPALPYQCTVTVARQFWNVYPTKLPDVCRHLSIPLQHHNALSDATACARIIIEARKVQQQANVAGSSNSAGTSNIANTSNTSGGSTSTSS